jgi:hypothetical protein
MIKQDLSLQAIHFQHLLNHRLDYLENLVKELKVAVFFILHDYFLICNEFKLIDSQNEFCGVSEPSEKKCQYCDNYSQGNEHFKQIHQFLENTNDQIEKFVAPSEYVAASFRSTFPQYADKIVVRPHLLLLGHRELKKIGGKIKLAYLGAQLPEKGFTAWNRLVKDIRKNCPECYEMFYFGTGKEVADGVTSVYVSTSEQGENAMVEHLQKYDISCAFVWPNWAETYSYVYYELAISGVFILSNEISGNIYAEIKKNKNGHIFKTHQGCYEWIMNYKNAIEEINNYRDSCDFKPRSFWPNFDLVDLLNNNGNEKNADSIYRDKEVSIHKKKVKTFLYRLKYRKFDV